MSTTHIGRTPYHPTRNEEDYGDIYTGRLPVAPMPEAADNAPLEEVIAQPSLRRATDAASRPYVPANHVHNEKGSDRKKNEKGSGEKKDEDAGGVLGNGRDRVGKGFGVVIAPDTVANRRARAQTLITAQSLSTAGEGSLCPMQWRCPEFWYQESDDEDGGGSDDDAIENHGDAYRQGSAAKVSTSKALESKDSKQV